MATFPNILPSQSSTYEQEFRVTRADFGDGYTQRSADGLNNTPRTLNLTWELNSASEIATIETFLRARGGAETFDYTPPSESVQLKWTCGGFTKTPGNGLYSTLTAVFNQEFDL